MSAPLFYFNYLIIIYGSILNIIIIVCKFVIALFRFISYEAVPLMFFISCCCILIPFLSSPLAVIIYTVRNYARCITLLKETSNSSPEGAIAEPPPLLMFSLSFILLFHKNKSRSTYFIGSLIDRDSVEGYSGGINLLILRARWMLS